MGDFISREAAIKEVVVNSVKHRADPDVATDMIRAIEKLPAADVRPVVRGKWEYIELIDGHSMGECSNCLKVRIVDNYCPNCGAKMGGEEE